MKAVANTFGRKKHIALLLAGICWCCMSLAQKAAAIIDRDKILIGEQVELQLKVADLPANTSVLQWFNLPDTFNHMEVVSRSKIDTIAINGSVSYVQSIKITSFDSGYWQIPSLSVNINNAVSQTPEMFVAVLPADVSGLTDYHDIKDILTVELKNDWRVIAAIIAVAVISIGLLTWLLLRRKARKVAPMIKRKDINNPYEWALQQIAVLQQQQLTQQQEYKLFYTELVDVCRTFSDILLKKDTTTKTTDEYMLFIKNRIGNEPVQTRYFQMLRLADVVKFARFIPSTDEHREAIDAAQAFVKTFYQFHNPS